MSRVKVIEAEPRGTGTDANAMQISRSGVAAGLVSIPNRYMHTQVEVVGLSDIEACAKLLAGAARSAGAIVSVACMPPRSLDGQEPTAAVAAAMKSAGVVLLAVQKSLAHTLAVRLFDGGEPVVYFAPAAASPGKPGGLSLPFLPRPSG